MKLCYSCSQNIYFFIVCLALLPGCNSKKKVDLIVYNAKVYTVNNRFDTSSAFAVKDGRFEYIGSTEEVLSFYEAADKLDAKKKSIYPGFIDAHCHFLQYGLGLQQADLAGTISFRGVIEKLVQHRNSHPHSRWIIGRGWDQNDWKRKEFPTKDMLDSLFPDVPVMLTRVDGHAALVNTLALQLAELTSNSKVAGGVVEQRDGKPTGILLDNAIEWVSRIIPEPLVGDKTEALLQAQKNCFAVGLTTVDEAGLDLKDVELIDSLQKTGTLKIRVYAMLAPTQENKQKYYTTGPLKTTHLNVRSFKVYADGALGSRGACLLQPYSDDPKNTGFLLRTKKELETIAQELYTHNFQMNTHCIGDSANRLMLNIYGQLLEEKNDRRWRIEHAQVVAPEDIQKFGQYSVIPSIQSTHATSDMYWAADRLGKERVKTAYSYKDLEREAGLVACGSDFPVESINPLLGFYAAVTRRDVKGFPSNGFQKENALDRKSALKGMTSWAAYSNFEEKEKGSIEKGKWADFVMLDKNIMSCPGDELPKTKILRTFVGGLQVYTSNQ